MTAPRRRYVIQPYNLTWDQVAESVFQKSQTWLRANLERLVTEQGFPRPDPRMDGLFNRAAVEAWVNGPYGLSAAPTSTLDRALMEAAAGGA